MKWSKNLFFAIIAVIIVFIVIRKCEEEPRVITKIEYITKTDTITETVIKDKPIIRYVERIKTAKVKDSIIYVSQPTELSVEAKEYEATVKTDSSRADLKILTTGELLDVKGTITYNQKETTITKIKDKSGFYVYGMIPVDNPIIPEVGGLYQFRNKMFISGGIEYNDFTKSVDFKVGIGVKLF